eukprot:TRINITY_DN45415_c0_g1_i1.p2 TRINITY_DN45415_c0_g1~~TRINITY_DN45415_c0_g1_i1.p2  ORF type:complete len:213 (-),score=18.49 TRINITY_DN45415_c0_g1_i1:271-909(-)
MNYQCLQFKKCNTLLDAKPLFLGLPQQHKRHYSFKLKPQALKIDHRLHYEKLYQRKMELDDWIENLKIPDKGVITIKQLAQLEAVAEKAGSKIVVVFLFDRGCGVCKEIRTKIRKIANEVYNEKTGVVFCEHDIRDDFDFLTDISQLYGIKKVPTFLFLVQGARTRTLSLSDVRGLVGSTSQIRQRLEWECKKMIETMWEMVFKEGPSARSF